MGHSQGKVVINNMHYSELLFLYIAVIGSTYLNLKQELTIQQLNSLFWELC